MLTTAAILGRWRRDQRGATAIEYALIGTLIAIACIGGMAAAGNSLEDYWNALAAAV